MNYREWVTRSKTRSSSLRRMLARRTNASECSSLQWQTQSGLHGGGISRGGDRVSEPLLPGQAKNWPTATTPDRGPESKESKESRGSGGIDLQTVAANWPSARAEDAESAGNHPGATDSLRGAIKSWASPAARDEKGPNSEQHRQTRERPHDDQLPNQAAIFPCSHPAETTTDAGLRSLLAVWSPPSRRALSADFQHWLMGWPSPVKTCFDSAAMELYRSRLEWRLSRLCGDSQEGEA